MMEYAAIATEVAQAGSDTVAADARSRLALERALFIIGEAANDLPPAVTDAIDQPWKDIIGLRHVLAHQYEGIEIPRLVSFARTQCPALVAALQAYLGQPAF